MPTETLPVFRDLDAPPARRVWGKVPLSRPVLLGGALAVTVACFAGLTAVGGLSERGTSVSGPAPSPTVSAKPSPTPSASPSSSVPQQAPSTSPAPSSSSSASASPSPSHTVTEDPPSGFFRYTAPQGFSVELPKGWKPVRTENSADGSYRVTLGASGDPRTLVVTYSTQLTSDPVAVWREVDTSLRGDSIAYERLGDIRAVTYQGYKGADMEWLSTNDNVRERTFGRGFLIGDHEGFSLRWTTPAADWDTTANQAALATFLRTFRGGSQ
jgi:hypothetical protein